MLYIRITIVVGELGTPFLVNRQRPRRHCLIVLGLPSSELLLIIFPIMSSTTTSSPTFQSIFEAALSDYATQTGIELATYPFVQTLQSCRDPGAILELLQERASQFRVYRDGNRKLINCLNPLVQVLITLSGVTASAASMVSSASDPVLSDHIFTLPPPGAISTNKCDSRRR